MQNGAAGATTLVQTGCQESGNDQADPVSANPDKASRGTAASSPAKENNDPNSVRMPESLAKKQRCSGTIEEEERLVGCRCGILVQVAEELRHPKPQAMEQLQAAHNHQGPAWMRIAAAAQEGKAKEAERVVSQEPPSDVFGRAASFPAASPQAHHPGAQPAWMGIAGEEGKHEATVPVNQECSDVLESASTPQAHDPDDPRPVWMKIAVDEEEAKEAKEGKVVTQGPLPSLLLNWTGPILRDRAGFPDKAKTWCAHPVHAALEANESGDRGPSPPEKRRHPGAADRGEAGRGKHYAEGFHHTQVIGLLKA